MKCSSGKHHWHDEISASRCCSPGWERILIMPGKRMKQVIDNDPKISWDGINHAPDGFKFAWRMKD